MKIAAADNKYFKWSRNVNFSNQQKDFAMQLRRTKTYGAAIAAIIMPAALLASPMAVVDTIDANLGDIIEGQATSAKHIFKVKNTGDSVLIIQSVKPG